MLNKRIEELEEETEIQCGEGNRNFCPYNHGLADGMVLALAIMKKERPTFLEAPEQWLCDKKIKGQVTLVADNE